MTHTNQVDSDRIHRAPGRSTRTTFFFVGETFVIMQELGETWSQRNEYFVLNVYDGVSQQY